MRAALLADKINTIFWDERDGFYYDRDEHTGELVKVKSAAGFLPLWAGIVSPRRAERLVKEHLTNPEEFWIEFPIACYAKTEPDYVQGDIRDWGCNWRGSTWIPTNYMIMHGLIDYGYADIAREMGSDPSKLDGSSLRPLGKELFGLEFPASDNPRPISTQLSPGGY